MTDQPSLLAFLLARLNEDIEAILGSTPFFGETNGITEDFLDRFLDRRAALNRLAADRAIVTATVAAMSDEQDAVLIGPEAGPVAALGTDIIKAMASRYANHPDYDPTWTPDGGMPNLR